MRGSLKSPVVQHYFRVLRRGDRNHRQTVVAFIIDVCHHFPGAEFWTNIFTPYPGSPIMHNTQRERYRSAEDQLRAGPDCIPRYTMLPWLKVMHIDAFTSCATICVWRSTVCRSRRWIRTPWSASFERDWDIRRDGGFDHDVYGLPVEVWIDQRLKRFVSVAKPKVDAERLRARPAARELPMKDKNRPPLSFV